MSNKFNKLLLKLIIITILINSLGLFIPILKSTFSPYYASIAKNIIISKNWAFLTLNNHDWLDKPHLPFWISALSFKIFGLKSFAYVLPGFIFHIIGVFYTYKLARLWYCKQIALISALFTSSTFHLLLSSIDVRAEAYLLGEIMPACYYLLKYYRKPNFKYFILSSIFISLSLMTKGIFILITIFSGLFSLAIIENRWREFFSLKWLSIVIFSIVLIFPEIISLYLQFDSHPEKIVFNRTHVSGISWYFWGSQFGRFFNFGPISSSNPPAFHQLFFIHTFLWAYLPWWPIFIYALSTKGKELYLNKYKIINNDNVYFYSYFFITFILFSLTKFQVDHYTNILFPFASIICAAFFYNIITIKPSKYRIYFYQLTLTIVLMLLFIILSYILFTGTNFLITQLILLISLIIFLLIIKSKLEIRIIIIPIVAILDILLIIMLFNLTIYSKYDVGYQMSKKLNSYTNIQIYGYNVDLLSLNFYSNNKYTVINSLNALPTSKSYYLVINSKDQYLITKTSIHIKKIDDFDGGTIEQVISYIISNKNILDKYTILKIN